MGNNTTRGVTDNEKLHAWLFPEQCWHGDWKEQTYHGFRKKEVCGKCETSRYYAKNPDYSSKLGFHDLLDGLKAKGYQIRFGVSPDEEAGVGIQHWEGTGKKREMVYDSMVTADTLPAALYEAALKAMESGNVG
jgi:hypothetical protein